MRDITYPPVLVIAKTMFKALGMKFQMTGIENIPREGGAVIASNHIGYVDWIYNGYPAERQKRVIRWMAKKEAFEGTTGKIMRTFHHIPVDRAAGEQSLRHAIDFAKAGELVGIFPEATISRAFEPKEFKTGAARIAHEAGVPLIPMAIWGTQLLKTKDHEADLWGRGKTIAIHTGEPIQTTGDAVADTATLKAAIEALWEKAVQEYPVSPEGQWWAPAKFGGTAPTLEQAAQMDADEYAARAARKAAKNQ